MATNPWIPAGAGITSEEKGITSQLKGMTSQLKGMTSEEKKRTAEAEGMTSERVSKGKIVFRIVEVDHSGIRRGRRMVKTAPVG